MPTARPQVVRLPQPVALPSQLPSHVLSNTVAGTAPNTLPGADASDPYWEITLGTDVHQ